MTLLIDFSRFLIKSWYLAGPTTAPPAAVSRHKIYPHHSVGKSARQSAPLVASGYPSLSNSTIFTPRTGGENR